MPKKTTRKSPCVIPDEITGDLKEALESFIEMRELIKKPLTQNALKIGLNRLKKLSKGRRSAAIEIIERSVFENYQGFFPLPDWYWGNAKGQDAGDWEKEKNSQKINHVPDMI